MNSQLLLFLVCLYAVLLFAVAWWSERQGGRIRQRWWRPLVYALSIGVYCSSWTFLGAVGQAVDNGWVFLPIYLGPILLLLLGWRFVRRLLMVSQRNKVTSIADFIGSRYGKSQRLAAVVTLVLVIGTLPYIALQLRAVGIAWHTINWSDTVSGGYDAFSSLIAAMAMAWFAILFGTRIIDGPDRYRGMITAVAVESVVKLVAFVVVAWLAIQLIGEFATEKNWLGPMFHTSQIFSPLFFTELLLGAAAIVCLPRQFHVMVVEYQKPSDLRYTRFLVPLYLATFSVLVLPLATAGTTAFAGLDLDTDSYVLILPRWVGDEFVLALTFLGTLSAATGMVVVATIALSIMISNELIVPVWLRSSKERAKQGSNLGGQLRFIRRSSILLILLMAWGLERVMSASEGLAAMGFISFAAAAQLLPAVVAGLYWKSGHSKGVLNGLLTGMLLWFYCLLLPALLPEDAAILQHGPLGLEWFNPRSLFGMGWLDPLSHGVAWSLLGNCLVFYLQSRRANFSVLDQRQADSFLQPAADFEDQRLDLEPSGIEVQQLQALMEPLMGSVRTRRIWSDFEQRVGHRLLPHDQSPSFVVEAIERDLAAIVGAVSAHRAMELLVRQQPLQLRDFASLVGGSTRQLEFSQSLLQTTLETIPQGISVVNRDLRLVAWNVQYQKLFDFPSRLLYIGCDIGKIYRYNAQRGYMGHLEDIDAVIERRLQQLRSGSSHRLERKLPNGRVIQIRGAPLESGGYVTTYTDVSDYYQMLEQLENSRDTLESRVERRTAELQDANRSLQRENQLRGRIEQELQEVHGSKSRFLAAASHDLLQPINAARLFVSALQSKFEKSETESVDRDLEYLSDSLGQAEQLISSMRELSRLDSGKERPKKQHFALESILQPLAMEAQTLARRAGLEFRWRSSRQWVYSDPHLLRRVVQNFISNALKYTGSGRVLLGCRRHSAKVIIEVWDTGPGIAPDDRARIFQEFQRLPATARGSQGLGLGLSIVDRIGKLLGHKISLHSEQGKGSVFRIDVPLGVEQPAQRVRAMPDPRLQGVRILCIDNEPAILAGMESLLTQWGCLVVTAADLGQVLQRWQFETGPDIVLADFHLDQETGLDLLEALGYHWETKMKAVVISADNSDDVTRAVADAGYRFLAKPAQPNALRLTLRQALASAN